MDKVTEEVLTSLIKRMEAIEQKVGIGQIPHTPTQTKMPEDRGLPLATPSQTKYIKALGGSPWPGMTKQEASQLLDKLTKRKEAMNQAPEKTQNQAPEKQNYEIPEDLSTLTEEEIKELEANGILM